MDQNDYLQNPMYFLSGVSKWVGGEDIFQIFLSKKRENQEHEIPKEILKREKKPYICILESKQTLTQSQTERKV